MLQTDIDGHACALKRPLRDLYHRGIVVGGILEDGGLAIVLTVKTMAFLSVTGCLPAATDAAGCRRLGGRQNLFVHGPTYSVGRPVPSQEG